MKQLILEGDLAATAQLQNYLEQELTKAHLDDEVTVESEILAAELVPGELGFGDEIRRILVGLGDLLSAVPDATVKIAEGIKGWLTSDTGTVEIQPDGSVKIKIRGTGQSIPEIAKEIARVVREQK